MSKQAVEKGNSKEFLLDDLRLQLPSNNVFRFCAQNGMPKLSADARAEVFFRTASEIEAERRASKGLSPV